MKNYVASKSFSTIVIKKFVRIFIGNVKLKIQFSINSFRFSLVASPEQFTMSQIAIERMVIAKIYTAALYPNGQADVQRDR